MKKIVRETGNKSVKLASQNLKQKVGILVLISETEKDSWIKKSLSEAKKWQERFASIKQKLKKLLCVAAEVRKQRFDTICAHQ